MRLFAVCSLFLAAMLVSVQLSAKEEVSPDELLKLADTYFKEKTFKKAIESYERFLAAAPDHAEAFRAKVSMARCHFGLRRWNDGLKKLSALLPTTGEGSLERARVAQLLGSTTGQRRGGSRQVAAWLDEAGAVYKKRGMRSERVETLFSLAHALCHSWDYEIDYKEWEAQYYKPDPANVKVTWQDYRQKKRLEEDLRRYDRVSAIYGKVVELSGGKGHDAARARYMSGCFMVNVLASAWGTNANYYPTEIQDKKLAQKIAELQENYTAKVRMGIAIWRKLIEENGDDALADDAQYLIAVTQHQRLNEFPEAVVEYEKLLTAFPSSEWVQTAKAALQKIRREEVRLNVPKTFLPGEDPEIGMAARNVAEIRFSAYRIDLPRLLRGKYRFHRLEGIDIGGLTPFAEWTKKTGVSKDHKGAELPVKLPFSTPGAFLIHADGDRSTCRALVIISGMGMVVKSTDGGVLILGTDASTGEPRPGVRYVLKATWRVNRVEHSKVFEGVAGEDGMASIGLEEVAARRPSVEIVGSLQDHVAVSGARQSYRSSKAAYKVYSYSDRPVYRPNQTVHLKCVVRAVRGEGYATPEGTAVKVEIKDPRGQKLYEKTLITNRYGNVSGDLKLGEEPGLGVYQVRTYIGGRQYYGYSWFRVEEYKKPEFEVVVDAGGRVKPGSTITATVTGKYYFGAPVAHGEATWQVFRQAYRHHMPVKRRYGWLYGDMHRAPSSHYGRELVTEGKGLLDDQGRLAIPFAAKDYGDNLDSRFIVEAKVTDASRREIRGSATVYATRQAFFVSAEARKSVLKPGDRAEVLVRAEDANRKPVTCEGRLELAARFDREQEKDGKKVVVTEWKKVGDVPGGTRNDGTASLSMVVDAEGQFRLSYVTAGPDGEEIRADTYVWVVSKDFAGSQYRFSGVEVATDRDTYAIGEDVAVLVNSHFEDAWILLTVEADRKILGRKLVKAGGRSHLETLRVTEAWTPNVFIKALTVRDSSVFMSRRQIVVPPEPKFLSVSLTPAREGTYLPGEEAAFTVKAVDSTGEPVQTELSVGFIDKSILYIQPDQTPDIRQFFYGEKRGDRVALSSSFDFSYRGSETLKQGVDWVKYRTQGLPQFMNQWFYTFQGFRSDVQGEMQGAWGAANGPSESKGRAFGGRGGSRAPGAPMGRMRRASKGEDRAMNSEESEADGDDFAGEEGGDSGPEQEVQVRKFFPDTAFWNAHVETGKDGTAEVTFSFPDSLTTWRATARAATIDTAVGSATAEYVTTKNIIMRLQAPRFFRERDELVISGIVHNYFAEDVSVTAEIKTEGDCLSLLRRGEFPEPRLSFTVKAGKEQRIDWWFKVDRPGTVQLTTTAATDRETDAVRMSFPVYEYGAEKFIALSGSFVGTGGRPAEGGVTEMRFVIPEARHEDATELTVSLSPSLAGVLLESLPYLADYPYGCVEQTMSRFVPAVVVKKTLTDLGFTLEDLGTPAGREVPSGYWGRKEVQKLKVLRDEDLAKLVAQGVARLRDFQHSDGSWGWWKQGPADLYMTSYVVRGLALAHAAGAEVDAEMLQKGARFLFQQLVNVDPRERAEKGMRLNPNTLVSVAGAILDVARLKPESKELLDRVVSYLYETRNELGATSRGLLAIALHRLDRDEEAGIVCENLTDNALTDKTNGTCRFGRNEGYYRWHDDAVEATAAALRAYLLVKPKSELIAMAAKWLATNRRGAHWKSTKDTAHAVLGLCEYLKVSKELDPDLTVKVSIDGRVAKTVRITRQNVFTADNRLTLRGADLAAGERVVTIEAEGRGNLYFSSHLTLFTREEHIKAAGNEIAIDRKAYRIHSRTREVTKRDWVKDHFEERTVTEAYDEREPLPDGAILDVGDTVEIELKLTAKNDYRYLVFEDMKGAGFEPLELRSGSTYSGILSYREFRDERVAFFCSALRQGDHVIRYRVRAEIPGTFQVMPARGHAMYLPEVRAISDGNVFSITEPGVR